MATEIGKYYPGIKEVELSFGATDDSKTATVPEGSVILGYYCSAFTGSPSSKILKLSISGTTLTGTLDAAPGSGNSITYKVIIQG